MSVPSKIANKNILIFGGTSGIGFAVARQALAEGAHVTVSSSSEEKSFKAVESLRNGGTTSHSAVRSYVADLSDRDGLEAIVENALRFAAEPAAIDHIVFTAGNITPLVPLTEATFNHVDLFLQVRLFAAITVAKHAPKYMNSGKGSSLTLTSTTESQKPTHWMPPIVGCAIEGLMKGLAVTLSPIRVNAVSLGLIMTEMLDKVPPEIKDQVVSRTRERSMCKDVGYPGDAAEAYLYLMKDQFAAGSVLSTNGGQWLV